MEKEKQETMENTHYAFFRVVKDFFTIDDTRRLNYKLCYDYRQECYERLNYRLSDELAEAVLVEEKLDDEDVSDFIMDCLFLIAKDWESIGVTENTLEAKNKYIEGCYKELRERINQFKNDEDSGLDFEDLDENIGKLDEKLFEALEVIFENDDTRDSFNDCMRDY